MFNPRLFLIMTRRGHNMGYVEAIQLIVDGHGNPAAGKNGESKGRGHWWTWMEIDPKSWDSHCISARLPSLCIPEMKYPFILPLFFIFISSAPFAALRLLAFALSLPRSSSILLPLSISDLSRCNGVFGRVVGRVRARLIGTCTREVALCPVTPDGHERCRWRLFASRTTSSSSRVSPLPLTSEK